MKTKTTLYDREFKSFALLSILVLFFLISVLVIFTRSYSYTRVPAYGYTLLILISVITVLISIAVSSVIAVSFTYRSKHVSRHFLWLIKIGMDFFMPNIISLSILLGYNKDAVRMFYIALNNIAVQSQMKKYSPGQILVLIPHCAQDSGCIHRITNDIGNCKRCGRCSIGKIAELAEKTGVCVSVVTGGTAALNAVSKNKPQLILASACERELVSGIIEVRRTPVIGMSNMRPNGPCSNTVVDVQSLEENLMRFISHD